MPTPAHKIKALIRTNGPISVTDYFALCLADQAGYYRTRDPFGTAGDFITAPEVSHSSAKCSASSSSTPGSGTARRRMCASPKSAPAAAR